MSDLLTPYKSVLNINSADRTTGTPGNFIVDLRTDLNTPNNYDSIVLISAAIPKSYYTFSSSNNTMVLIEGGVNTTVTITPGNYDGVYLATYLGTIMTTASTIGATYTVSLSLITGKLTFTTTSATATSLNFVGKLSAYVLGFDDSTYSFSALTLTAPYIVNLQFTSTINVFCDLVGGKSKKLAQIIPNQADFGVIGYQETCPAYVSQPLLSNSGTSANFYFQDEYGTQLDFNNIDLQMVVVVYKSDQFHNKSLVDRRLALVERNVTRNGKVNDLEQ